LILSTDVDRVRGRAGCSGCVWGEAISSEGLEQLPREERDREPLAFLDGGDSGVEGVEERSGEARLTVLTRQTITTDTMVPAH
jgi:hypothetical protein